MEEVDHIIIHTLKQINCDIDDKVETLKEFSTELIIEATVKCLRLIQPSLEFSYHLPPGMSARFRLGSHLAQTCTDLGYQGEIGYQTFLYSGEADIRRVFMFLMEKLPKEMEKSVDEPLGGTALLNQAITEVITKQLNLPWIPYFCKNKGIRWKGNHWTREGTSYMRRFSSCAVAYPQCLEDISVTLPKELHTFYKHHQLQVTKQPNHASKVIPSIFEDLVTHLSAAQEWETEWNQIGLATRLSEQDYRAKKKQRVKNKISSLIQQEVQKNASTSISTNLPGGRDFSINKLIGSRFGHSEKLHFTSEPNTDDTVNGDGVAQLIHKNSEEEEKEIRAKEVAFLQCRLKELSEQLESLQIDGKKYAAGIQQMNEQISSFDSSCGELEDTYRLKKKTIDLLPDSEVNMKKLQALIESCSQRLVSLASQWERHRAPLIEQYRQLKETRTNRLTETQRKIEEIKILREKIKELTDDTWHKEELYKQLIIEYEKNAKDVNRAAYTRRILEIVGNIKKQKIAIDKVLTDTKEVQKEINQLSGKLDRTFTVTDELVFRDAKKDESVRKAYKYLAALHENCNLLIKTVEETGAITREIRDLEDQIENESQKKVQENLERIMADYKQMKQENAALLGKLKVSENS